MSGASDSRSSSDSVSFSEAKRLMRLVNVEALKRKLGMENKEVIEYNELLDACEGMGVLRTKEETVAFAKVLDDAGVVLLFRDKVYLHPDKCLADILMGNSGIQKLQLISTGLGDEGAKAIAEMLKMNSMLCILELNNNTIDYVGFSSLAGALLENNTIRSIHLNDV